MRESGALDTRTIDAHAHERGLCCLSEERYHAERIRQSIQQARELARFPPDVCGSRARSWRHGEEPLMPHPRETADLARRDLLHLGLVGASVLALGTGGSILAGDEGIDRKVLKEVDSNIPCFAKLRIRDTIFQPG